ncbi:MAG: hypothetical protein DSM107014_01355 [Gomphosphaeria aponina SAG 52.96 = DSM 107014]|uniref:Glucosyltransferase 3-like C-terminal domain-containing protein n=1 Tax=Gomphosphaeria aponina SAG 52.96 = DSM 107014 TaxID=1521640 RepID=A0A941GR97_9CHRO|nr:hypothetical protein [Gomphosphaeria aponina SAG 52.96 = DSM 107014]
MKNQQEKRVAIIFNDSLLDTVPCLLSFIKLLVEKSINVDIFIVNNGLCRMPKDLASSLINVYINNIKQADNEKILGSYTLYRIQKLWNFYQYILSYINHKEYLYTVGVEQDGLIISWLIAIFKKIPFIYFSLELYLSLVANKTIHGRLLKGSQSSSLEHQKYQLAHKTIHGRLFKVLEKKANNKALLTIIQDPSRAKLLAEDNQINLDNIYSLPNSPLGQAKYNKQYFLQEKFKIGKEKIIILNAGTLADWSYTKEISTVATQLPDKYLTFFQSRFFVKDNDNYIKGIRDMVNPEKVIFSLTPFPYKDIDNIYRSADIGLAFYNTKLLGTNCQEIGLSSGKIAHYLFTGIPVIVNKETSLAQLVNEYECGIVIDEFKELECACKKIMDKYQFYSDNACNCFNKLLAVEPHFQKIYHKLFITNS